MEKCKICNGEFNERWLLKKHISQKHKETNVAKYIVDYELNGKWPECKCGCGQKLNYFPGMEFGEYLRGHISSIKNNWGHNKNAIEKSKKTRKRKWKSGEIQIWNKGVKQTDNTKYGKIVRDYTKKMNTPERAEKISKANSGLKRSKLYVKNVTKFWKKYWSNEENRNKQRERHIEWLKIREKNIPSSLEIAFKEILNEYKLKYEYQYEVQYHLYDFYLPKYNILIETDGDFWHCKDGNIVYEVQKNVAKNDKIKNEIAKKYGYKLLRFWESDVQNNRLDIVQTLLNEIKN